MSQAAFEVEHVVRFITPAERAAAARANAPALAVSEVFAGFDEALRRVGSNTEMVLQTAAHTFALAEVLVARGVIGLDELEHRRRAAEDRLRATSDSEHVVHLAPDQDKYGVETAQVEIDCAERLPICHAACCRLRFPLSRQDIAENVTQWELDRPYLNRQREDGYCVHCDHETHGCTVYDNRPATCRTYDCRNDARIWADFERRIPSANLVGLFPDASAAPVLQH